MRTPTTEVMARAALFLSRYGRAVPGGPPLPPEELQTTSWRAAYAAFYASLGGARTFLTFCNSLKNARDRFDAYHDSGRAGWRHSPEDRQPAPLPRTFAKVWKRWGDVDRSALWASLVPHVDLTDTERPDVLEDLAAVDAAAGDVRGKTEGGVAVRAVGRAERKPANRAAALKIHGTACMACGFDFGAVYGALGVGFAEVHHVIPLGGPSAGERVTDPHTDLVVLCANCHRMVHRKRGVVLTIPALQAAMAAQTAAAGVPVAAASEAT